MPIGNLMSWRIIEGSNNDTLLETHMARQEVTFDEVTAAATSLQKDGEQVTIETVREKLGTGLPHTIHKHLVEWRAGQAKPAPAPKVEIPEPLVAALGAWAQQFAQEAGAGVRDALAQSEDDMDALIRSGEELETERDDLLHSHVEVQDVVADDQQRPRGRADAVGAHHLDAVQPAQRASDRRPSQRQPQIAETRPQKLLV